MFGQTISTTISVTGLTSVEFCCTTEKKATILRCLATVLGIDESLLIIKPETTCSAIKCNQFRALQSHSSVNPSPGSMNIRSVQGSVTESISLQISAVVVAMIGCMELLAGPGILRTHLGRHGVGPQRVCGAKPPLPRTTITTRSAPGPCPLAASGRSLSLIRGA